MILQALYEYYNILEQAGEIAKPGYAPAQISYALEISEEGALTGFYSLREMPPKGKKEVPRTFTLPSLPDGRTSTAIKPAFLWDKPLYVLGVDEKHDLNFNQKRFQAFRDLHHEVLHDVQCPAALALLRFLDQWEPSSAQENPLFADAYEELHKGVSVNITFVMQGGTFLHTYPEVTQAWERYDGVPSDAPAMQCLLTGEQLPIARLHNPIKGIRGGQSMGNILVAFNKGENAYESYGNKDAQGLNAPVSARAAFAYATALNHLLSNSETRVHMGDTTVVFWAQSPEKAYGQAFSWAMNPSEEEDKAIFADIQSMMARAAKGEPVNFTLKLDPDMRFCILGLAPNAARAAVRFFYMDSFGNIISNLARHFQDIEIERSPKEFTYLPLWALLDETVSKNDTKKESRNLLAGAVGRSIIMGIPYPRALFNAVMLRVKAEREITRGKAAVIKAYLLRQPNFEHKEECLVSLNKESTNQAYVLGRLFAVLEKAQKDALPGINSTIKDRYFTSACAAPRATFPLLLKLAQHHMAKAEFGNVSQRRVSELLEKLDVEDNPFPAQLSLESQGLFVLGYYHQSNENYRSNKKEEENTNV